MGRRDGNGHPGHPERDQAGSPGPQDGKAPSGKRRRSVEEFDSPAKIIGEVLDSYVGYLNGEIDDKQASRSTQMANAVARVASNNASIRALLNELHRLRSAEQVAACEEERAHNRQMRKQVERDLAAAFRKEAETLERNADQDD